MSKHKDDIIIVEGMRERRMAGKVVNPIPGYPVTYGYGVKSNAYQAGHHTGEDHSTDHEPGKQVIATCPGKVVEIADESSSWGSAYGGVIVVRMHDDSFRAGYCHLSEIFVLPGNDVVTGQVIGLSGGVPGDKGAGNSTGAHLHFEVRQYPFHYGDDVHPFNMKQKRAGEVDG
jgi:murein DD-endopeptidase MepM/ murein hydrolase activator NlpD